MSRLPSLDLYNEAVQNPRTAFTDSQLQAGRIQTSGLGLPVALGGGFAITYHVQSGGRSYAVRVFHKQATGLEDKYRLVSGELSRLPSPYFVPFEFQANGIRVNGSLYPVVKMEWATGDTLGTYVERQYKDRAAVEALGKSFRDLATHLRSRQIAHGDIQTLNVMVDQGRIRLIDYDGMFVPTMVPGNGTEIGHRHFQHPNRGRGDFGSQMDRFSFIAMDLTLRAIAERPDLYIKYGTTGENILFTGNDYQDPASSPLFTELRGVPSLRKAADDFAAVCRGPIASVPDLEDFIAGRGIPTAAAASRTPSSVRAAYAGSLPVVDATNFDTAARHVGDRVEVIGQITDVKYSVTRRGHREYVFINFGNWRDRIVKVTVWSTGLARLRQRPDDSWVGKWISVTGLIDPPYSNPKFNYLHLSITVEEPQQLHIIDAREATYRLGGQRGTQLSGTAASSNRELIEGLRRGSGATPGGRSKRSAGGHSPASSPQRTANQKLIDSLNGATKGRSPAGRPGFSPTRSTRPTSSGQSSPQDGGGGGGSTGCLVGIGILILLIILGNLR